MISLNNQISDELSLEELNQVAGGVRVPGRRPLQAEDAYGNKLSPEDFMDYQMAVFNGQAKPFDFTSWDSDKVILAK